MTGDEPTSITGDIAIQGDRIIAVGPEIAAAGNDRIIDASRCIAMPGLVNAHTHLAMTLLRNCADDLDLFTWLNEHIWPREALLTPDDIYAGSLLGLAELIRGGVTTYADMYFHQDETVRATLESGISANIGATIIGDEEETRKRLPVLKDLHSRWNQAENGRIRIDVAPHAIYTCSAGSLTLARDLAASLGTMLHIHLSESMKEHQDCMQAHGKTPAEYLYDLGIFEVPVYAAHCVHLSREDVSLCAKLGVRVVHNPTSNLKLANGIAPVQRFLDAGIPVALGTDGASSNNNLNVFEEMHIASVVQKASTGDPKSLNAYDTLRAATVGGAKALGREHEIGMLKPGMMADLILISTDAPHFVPLNNPVSAVVYSAQASDVATVIARGKMIMRNREILTLDMEEVYARAGSSAEKLRLVR